MDKHEWTEVWHEIQNHLVRLEKKQPSVLKGFEDILREERIAKQNREQFLVKTKKKLHNIKLEIAGIQRYIQDVCSAAADPKSLQGMLEKFETKLSDYKLVMRNEYSSLATEEESITEALNEIAVSVGIWESEPLLQADPSQRRTSAECDTDASTLRVAARQAQMLDYHAKIGALDRRLANMGGRTGGWDPRDHDSFLRVLTILQTHPTYNNVDIFSNVIKSVGMDEELHLMGEATAAQSRAHPVSVNPQYVAKFVSFLPGKTVDEIEEHVIWHAEHLSIQSEKKLILSEWRDERANMGQGINRIATYEVPDASNHSVSIGTEKNSNVNSKFDEASLAAKREKVEQWRKIKMEELKAEKVKEDFRTAAAKAREDEEKLSIRQQNRLKLEQWRVEADAKRGLKDDVSIPARPKSVDPASMRRRQNRDLDVAKERLKKKSAKEQSLHSREARLRETEKLRMQWEGPSKLFSSTKAADAQKVTPEELDEREHMRKHGGAHSARVASGGYDLKYSGRAIPAWTRGVQF